MTAPTFIYGTAWKEARTEALTAAALAAGFRAVDTANQRKHYVEAAVGAAVARSGLARDALFLQSKFTHVDGQDARLPYDPRAPVGTQVAQSFASSLEHLGTTYLDAYILHGPTTKHGLAPADLDAWRAMEALVDEGRARAIGVSNVTREQLERLCAVARVRPAYVQSRCYARDGWDAAVRAFCRAEGIAYQGFSLLTANRRELGHASLAAIARRVKRTREQVVLRFAQQVGMIPLTGTSSATHLREDLAIADFALDAADVRAIESIAV